MSEVSFFSAFGDTRRCRMLAAVARVLVDEHTRAVEMQEILEQTGLLHEDFAGEFRDLDDILLELARRVSSWISEPISSDAVHPASREDVLEALMEFGRRYTHANLTILPGLLRVFLTESSRRSGLRKDFYEAGPARISEPLADFLQRSKQFGVGNALDSRLIAEALMGMLREPLYYKLAIHSRYLSRVLSSVERAPDIVRMFAEGCAVGRAR